MTNDLNTAKLRHEAACTAAQLSVIRDPEGYTITPGCAAAIRGAEELLFAFVAACEERDEEITRLRRENAHRRSQAEVCPYCDEVET